MKRYLEININEKEVKESSEMESLEDAINSEIGWLTGSGITVENNYKESNIVILDKKAINTSSMFNPMTYARTCEKFMDKALIILKEDGVFKSYDDNSMTILIKIKRSLETNNPMEKFASDYVIDTVKEIIKEKRSKYKININDVNCIQDTVDKIEILFKESFLNSEVYNMDIKDKSQFISDMILEFTDQENIIFDEIEEVYVYTNKMQNIADKIYDAALSLFEDNDFSAVKQYELLKKLVEEKHVSKDVADMILEINNGRDYENILTDNNLHKTKFAKFLEDLVE